jgi:hypothetical protein
MLHTYTAPELARAAGYSIRRVPSGGVREVDCFGQRILELGPDATELEITRFARRHLVLPASCRVTDVTPAVTLRAV